MAKRVYIYALLDPDTGRAFYVGKSRNFKERFKKHVRYAKQFLRETKSKFALSRVRVKCGRKKYPNIEKTARIAKLISCNKLPKLIILDSHLVFEDTRQENNFENAWIHEAKKRGHMLTNVLYPYTDINGCQSDLTPNEYIAKVKGGC